MTGELQEIIDYAVALGWNKHQGAPQNYRIYQLKDYEIHINTTVGTVVMLPPGRLSIPFPKIRWKRFIRDWTLQIKTRVVSAREDMPSPVLGRTNVTFEELREITRYLVELGWEKTFDDRGVRHYRIGDFLIRVKHRVEFHHKWSGYPEYPVLTLDSDWKATIRDWTLTSKAEELHEA